MGGIILDNKMTKLYFTDDFSPENVKKLREQGYLLRNVRAYHEADAIEVCDEVVGMVPERYKQVYENAEQLDLTKLSVSELREHLAELGIEFDPKASKAELLKLIEA